VTVTGSRFGLLVLFNLGDIFVYVGFVAFLHFHLRTTKKKSAGWSVTGSALALLLAIREIGDLSPNERLSVNSTVGVVSEKTQKDGSQSEACGAK